ncbi:hypothetical protein R1sor_025878 [Riccia sorocarpa]|uniref:Integrase catalytic domain-containing protein n=1 Tax=Riccia sorocarpa TaxID=122646 RepID=A0ABD3G9W4_9MARC
MASGTGFTSIKPTVFDGRGYLSWSKEMKMHFRSERLLRIVEGKEKEPEITMPGDAAQEKANKDWLERDDRATAIIGMCISHPILMEVDADSGSATLWKWIEKKFCKKQEADLLQMTDDIYELKFTFGDLKDHIVKLRSMFDAIELADKEYKVPEGQQKLQLYRSLPWEYREFVDSLTIDPSLKWHDAATLLLQKETRIRNYEKQDVKMDQAALMNQAILASSSQRQRGRDEKKGGLREELMLTIEETGVNSGLTTFTVDSACTSTMLMGSGQLVDSKKSVGRVQLGNQAVIPVTKTGRLKLLLNGNSHVKLEGSLVVPGLRKNLLSVAKIADSGLVTVFDKRSVRFYRGGVKIEGFVVGEGNRVGNLYEFTTARSSRTLPDTFAYLLYDNGRSGARYIITFIDDVSRRIVVYFLRAKSDALVAFKAFKAEAENQVGRKIKVLRSDGGGEYLGHEFNDFCRDQGITRQVTTPYTPQLNGVAERKNRTLVEAARSADQDINGVDVPAENDVGLPHEVAGGAAVDHTGPTVARDMIVYERRPRAGSSSGVSGQGGDSARSTRSRRPSRKILENAEASLAADMCFILEEPEDIEEALNGSEGKQWKLAAESELKSMAENQVWKLVELPAGRKVVDCKWVLRRKLGADGKIQRYKARLVAKGFTQIRGIDFEETFSPVVAMDSFRAVMAMAAAKDWEVQQMDVDTTFLNGELEEEIYMRHPPDFEELGKKHLVCRLKCAIYGLRQASRAWFQKFDRCIRLLGFKESSADDNVYLKEENGKTLLVLLYVDDMLLFGDNAANIEKLKCQFSAQFKMKDLEPIDTFLGIKVRRNRKEKKVTLSQERYVQVLLERFNMVDCKPASVPMTPRLRLFSEENFQDWPCGLTGMVDARFGTNAKCKSTTGFCYFLHGGVISWSSKKQSLVTVSTAEAEYVAMSAAVRRMVKYVKLLGDVTGTEIDRVPLGVDSQSAICIADKPSFRSKTVHIPVHFHFVREKVQEGLVKLVYTP